LFAVSRANEKQRPRRFAAGALGGEAMRRQNEDTAPLTHVSGVGTASSCPFWKDLRGDNMKMRSDFFGTRRSEGQAAPVKTDSPMKTDEKTDD
jgi:hypothetical protein